MTKHSAGRGCDIGTSNIIASRELTDGRIQYTVFRDAFYRIKPASPVARKMMEKGLRGQQYFIDTDGSFVVIGQDAIERAIERHDSASRPMERGVISPREREARRILRHILKEILPDPLPDEKVVYSIPAQPIDQPADTFDIGFHTDAMNNDIRALGFIPEPIYEAEAICYSELEDNDFTGLSMSFGAGAVNVCLMSSGEGIKHFSTTKSGDTIDRLAAIATAEPDTVVQVEKENTQFTIGSETAGNRIISAISLYYIRVIDYTVGCVVKYLSSATDLPKFVKPIPVVLAGGTSLAKGFVEQFTTALNKHKQDLPFEVLEVRHATQPLHSVSRGCLLAARL